MAAADELLGVGIDPTLGAVEPLDLVLPGDAHTSCKSPQREPDHGAARESEASSGEHA